MSDAGDGEAPNEGARLLRTCGLSLAAVVKLLGAVGVTTTKQSVDRWKKGKLVPAVEVREAFARTKLAWPVGVWEQPAGRQNSKPVDVPTDQATKAPENPKRPPATPPPDSDEALPAGVGTASELAEDYLARIQRYRELAEGAKNDLQRRQWLQLESQAIRTFAKLTGQEAAPEVQLVKSPYWQRLRAALVEALRPHPEALRDVIKRLEALRA